MVSKLTLNGLTLIPPEKRPRRRPTILARLVCDRSARALERSIRAAGYSAYDVGRHRDVGREPFKSQYLVALHDVGNWRRSRGRLVDVRRSRISHHVRNDR